MRGLIGKIFSYFGASHELHIKRNVVTYGVCVIIATVLWFLNALNKEYTTEITYPIKYMDLPKGKLLVSEPPKEMTLAIKAHGFALLRYSISTSFLPIVLNVNSLLDKKDQLEYTVNTSEIKDRISAQLTTDIQLISIKPESITFQFSRFESKRVPVIPRVDYTLKRQYMLKNDISVTPDYVDISGPASILDTLKAVYTEPISLKNLSKDVTKTVSFEEIYGTQINENDAKVKVEVERFTESKKTVPLVVKNLPDTLLIRLFPHAIDVTFDVGLSRYEVVSDTSFSFYVDYNQIKNNPASLKIQIERSPRHIKDLVFTPETVEYLIEKKK